MPRRENPLLLFMAQHLAVGIVVGWSVLGALIWLDVGGLKRLIAADSSGFVAVAMLMIFFAITFGSAAMGSAIMSLRREEDEKKRRDPPPGGGRPAPVTVPAHGRR